MDGLLSKAIEDKKYEVIEYLIQQGIIISQEAINAAISGDDLELLKKLIPIHYKVSQTDLDKCTNPTILKFLLQQIIIQTPTIISEVKQILCEQIGSASVGKVVKLNSDELTAPPGYDKCREIKFTPLTEVKTESDKNFDMYLKFLNHIRERKIKIKDITVDLVIKALSDNSLSYEYLKQQLIDTLIEISGYPLIVTQFYKMIAFTWPKDMDLVFADKIIELNSEVSNVLFKSIFDIKLSSILNADLAKILINKATRYGNKFVVNMIRSIIPVDPDFIHVAAGGDINEFKRLVSSDSASVAYIKTNIDNILTAALVSKKIKMYKHILTFAGVDVIIDTTFIAKMNDVQYTSNLLKDEISEKWNWNNAFYYSLIMRQNDIRDLLVLSGKISTENANLISYIKYDGVYTNTPSNTNTPHNHKISMMDAWCNSETYKSAESLMNIAKTNPNNTFVFFN